MTDSPSKVLVIVGPTAAGKSAVAEAVADRVDSDIVSADSMQVYRGMDIATDKPDLKRRKRYRYHLIDVADPDEPFTVVRYRDLARKAIDGIAAAGRLSVLVGGSGLYVRAVIDDLEFPPAARDLSESEREQLENGPADELWDELRRVDPAAAARIHRNNRRRLARALEFIAETGHLFSETQERWSRYESIYDVRIFGIQRERQPLLAAIDRRVDAMITAGLADEARRLASSMRAGSLNTSRQALGYKELSGYLEGTQELGEAADALKRATKRFAKRQMTWFRADARVQWIDAENVAPEMVADQIVASLRQDKWLDAKLMRTGGRA